jgi:hypothetical protein
VADERKTEVGGPIRGEHELRVSHEFAPNPQEEVVASVPWRASVDVYAWGLLQTGTQLMPSEWKLYAISGQVRVMVARNIMAIAPNLASVLGPDVYIMGERNIVCDRFEVTCRQLPFTVGGPTIPSVPSKVCVTGFGVEPNGPPRGFPSPPIVNTKTRPPGVAQWGGEYGGGAIRRFDAPATAVLGGLVSQGPALLVEASGFSTAASTRWVMLFPFFPVPPANGVSTFQYVIQVPAGASFSYTPSGGEFFPHDWGATTLYAAGFVAGPGLTYAVSTTPFVLTRELVDTMAIDLAFYGVP